MEKLQNSVHEKNAHREAALREKYPLHCAVWNNNYREVERLLANKVCKFTNDMVVLCESCLDRIYKMMYYFGYNYVTKDYFYCA